MRKREGRREKERGGEGKGMGGDGNHIANSWIRP